MLELRGSDAGWIEGADVNVLPDEGGGPKLDIPDGELDNDDGTGQML